MALRAVLGPVAVMAMLAVPLPGAAQEGVHANAWSGTGFSTFHHVLEAAPGRRTLTLQAQTDASGGETVAVYPEPSPGVRGKVRLMFVIASTRGNTRTATVNFPAARRGETLSRLPVMVVVENASGRRHAGNYTLRVN